MKGTSNTNLCDLLDISDRLETELELSEGSHVTGILRSSTQGRLLGRNAGECPPCEHYEGIIKNESRLCHCVGSSRAGSAG